MDLNSLKKFLIRAKARGYAGGNQTKESNGSYSTRFAERDFKFHDNWFGGEPFGGREVVLYKGKPYWIMVYYGADFTGKNLAIPTLMKALSNMPDNFPARGPESLKNGTFEYKNKWEGNIDRFSGKEEILENGKIVYNAKYAGGLVDQRK